MMIKKRNSREMLKKITFNEYELLLRPLQLLRCGSPVDAQLMTLRLIALLAHRKGALVTHDEIHRELWGGRSMEVQRNIHVCVHQARVAFGENAASSSMIENIPGQGYRFNAPVELAYERLPKNPALASAFRDLIQSSSATRFLVVAALAATAMVFAVPCDNSRSEDISNEIAQNAFEQGVSLSNRDDPDSQRRSIAYFDTAIDADQNFAEAHIEASKSYLRLGQFGNAATSARNALTVNDDLSEAYTLIGLVNLMHEWEWDSALQNLARGVSRNPRSADAHHGLGSYYVIHGDFESAIKHLRQSYQLSGGSSIAGAHLGWAYLYSGDFENAIAMCGKNITASTSSSEQRRCYIKALHGAQRYDEARQQIEVFMHDMNAMPSEIASVAGSEKSDFLSEFDAWRFQQLNQSKEKFPESSAHLAFAAAGAGNYDRALFYAKLAINERCSMIPFVAVDPVFRPMFDDPEFQALLRKLRLL